MRQLILICALLFAGFAHAEVGSKTVKFQYGVGFNEDTVLDDEIRSINLGHYWGLNNALSWAVTGGYYGDKLVDLNAGYACGQFGASLNPFEWMFVENYFGPCYFSEAKGRISGHLQFATNIGAGWRDPKTGSEIGLNWKHFSNAGLSKPNMGADLLMLSLAFGL